MKVIIKFSEIWIKGQNRDFFIDKLINNIKTKGINVERRWDHLYANTELNETEIKSKLNKTFGISSFIFVNECNQDVENIKEEVLQTASKNKDDVYKVKVQRSDKSFSIKSPELSKMLGLFLTDKGYKTHLKKYNNSINVLITTHSTYIYNEKDVYNGPKGLPVGVSGKTMCLLSGGIDSPVAVQQIMKRGCEVVLLHFYRTPEIDDKMVAIKDKLDAYHKTKLIGINFLSFQNQIVKYIKNNNEKYRMVIYRKYMFKIAEQMAKKYECKGIVTGESIGQVASQTLENMYSISKGIDMLIIRPLITKDKMEIVNIAKQIDTFELSIIPYKDCCTYLTPKHPATKSRIHIINGLIKKLEDNIDKDMEQIMTDIKNNNKIQIID